MASGQKKIRFNAFSGYVFDDNHVDSYYDPTSYYDGSIQGGYQWGGGLELMLAPTKGIEFKYLRQDCVAPMEYYDNGVKNKNFNLGINYLLLGGTNYFRGTGEKVEPFAGAGLGMAIINVKNTESNSSDTTKDKFAWNIKLGTNVWINERIGLKLQTQLLSAVQSVGGSFYFGTGGAGAGMATYSTMYQFELGGGLVFKLGK
jgi:opacity protein-like surface antigen